jgi:hypothetical protein
LCDDGNMLVVEKGGGEEMKKRIVLLVALALVAAAMMVATAMPALAVTAHDCADTFRALYRGEELTAQDQLLQSQYPSFGACVQANASAGTD